MRLEWIDRLKGLAILLVVAGHFIQQHVWGGESENNVLVRIIYTFHMPLFFFLSGYVSWLSPKSYFTFFKNKCRSILLPYISWSLLYLLILSPNSPSCNVNDYIYLVLPSIFDTHHYGGLYWFLRILFILQVLLLAEKIIIRFFKRCLLVHVYINILLCIVVFCIGILFKQLSSIMFILHLLSFMLGYYCSQSNYFDRLIDNKNVFYIALCTYIVAFLFYEPLTDRNIYHVIIAWSLKFLMALTAIVCVLYLFRNIFTLNSRVNDLLKFFGQHSLMIYLVPMKFLPYQYMLPENCSSEGIALITILYSTIRCYIVSYISIALSLVPGIKFILCGKK